MRPNMAVFRTAHTAKQIVKIGRKMELALKNAFFIPSNRLRARERAAPPRPFGGGSTPAGFHAGFNAHLMRERSGMLLFLATQVQRLFCATMARGRCPNKRETDKRREKELERDENPERGEKSDNSYQLCKETYAKKFRHISRSPSCCTPEAGLN